MSSMTRRWFLLSTGALSAGCVARPLRSTAPTVAEVRPPAVGQSWEYSKHDAVSGVLVDVETMRISTIGEMIKLETSVNAPDAVSPASHSWGEEWLPKHKTGQEVRVLASEVQKPWGMVLVDPHWGDVQVYERPIPLWPAELHPGWSARIKTRIRTFTDQSALPWDITMHADQWESVTVAAGRFDALRYRNLINFGSPDFSRVDSQRHETIWFAPEVGRWIARESSETYFHDDSVDDRQIRGDSFRWELSKWS